MDDSLTQFLLEFKLMTEEFWANYETLTLEESRQMCRSGPDWQRGTRWLGGLSEAEVESLEQSWGARFPYEYRHFLRVLGAPDRPQLHFGYGEGDSLDVSEGPSFYNWQTEATEIARMLNWPLEGLLFDVEHNLWLDGWGPKPDTLEARLNRVTELVAAAPRLIPIYSHRYVLDYPLPNPHHNLVLSVNQSDIIVYGYTLRNYLLTELYPFISADTMHNLRAQRIDSLFEETVDCTSEVLSSIPFWGELIS